jgi:uncharacterized protein (TIGR02271 family)
MEPRMGRVEPGAAAEASDGRLGTVDEVIVRPGTGELAYLVVRRGWSDEQVTIPADLIESIRSPREVHLRVTRDEAREHGGGLVSDSALARDAGDGLRIPILEERLVPGKRPVDLGELRIHKYVEEVEEVISQPVTRDDLVIERVPINRPLEAPVEPREEGEWLVVPIMEEVLVVQKRLMLAEEVRIRKRQVSEAQEVRGTVRRERVELEDATVHGVRGLREAADPRGRVRTRAPETPTSPLPSPAGPAISPLRETAPADDPGVAPAARRDLPPAPEL